MHVFFKIFVGCAVLLSCLSPSVCFSKPLGVFTISFYDNCSKCCGKDVSHPAYGITASGARTQDGYAACNWLPFGTVVEIVGLGTFVIKDRGSKRLFGTFENPIKRIDVWVPTHAEALKLGKQTRNVILTKS